MCKIFFIIFSASTQLMTSSKLCSPVKFSLFQLLSNTFLQIVDRTNLYSKLRVLLQKIAMKCLIYSQLPSYFLVQEGVNTVIITSIT